MYSYYGLCANAKEAAILFEAAKTGVIPTINDRLSEEERKGIVSGAIYIWDEKKSPMKRWTDGRTWSNSRVVGDFLEYRQTVSDNSFSKANRYQVKPGGLKKRSICLPSDGYNSLRLIAYYLPADEARGVLRLPSEDPQLADIVRTLEKIAFRQSNHLHVLDCLTGHCRRKPCDIFEDQVPVKDPKMLHPTFRAHLDVSVPKDIMTRDPCSLIPLPIHRPIRLQPEDQKMLDMLNMSAL